MTDLRFGIQVGTGRSRCWRVRSGARRPELFIEREGLERTMHLSLHESGQWHLKVKGQGKAVQWLRPAEVVPGFIRAVCLVQPSVVAVETLLEPHPEAVLLALPVDAAPMHFDVFIERPGANIASWPGKNSEQNMLVGRIPLAGGAGTCCVVARQALIEPGALELPRPSQERVDEMRAAMDLGHLYTTLVARQADGTLAMIDMRAAHGEPATSGD